MAVRLSDPLVAVGDRCSVQLEAHFDRGSDYMLDTVAAEAPLGWRSRISLVSEEKRCRGTAVGFAGLHSDAKTGSGVASVERHPVTDADSDAAGWEWGAYAEEASWKGRRSWDESR